MLDEDIGRVPGQHIAHDTAADAGQQADEHKKIGAAVRREVHGIPDTHDGEHAETDRVHEQQGNVKQTVVVHEAVADPRDAQQERHADGHKRARRVAEGEGRRDAENDVAQDAAADGGDDAEHDDTEQVHMPAHGGQRAGGCKGHRADEFEKKYEFIHRYR